MTKEFTAELYSSTTKLMRLLQDEIEILETTGESAVDVKRNVAEILSKLANVRMQLGKLSKEEPPDDGLGEDDQAIIDEFLARSR